MSVLHIHKWFKMKGVLLLLVAVCQCIFCLKYDLLPANYSAHSRNVYGGDLHIAIVHILKGFPADQLNVVFDNHTDYNFLILLCTTLSFNDITVVTFNITTVENQDVYFSTLAAAANNFLNVYTMYFVTEKLAEHILLELNEYNLIRRNMVYMFHWRKNEVARYFVRNMNSAMKIIAITNPRFNAYRIYYNQGTSHKNHHLSLVNWWINGKSLFNHPTIPKALEIYKDFKGRLIYVPVIHKPPWHFVRYVDDTIQVLGGRDDKLLRLLSERLNFRFQYFDPPERIQGSSFSANGTFGGVLGLIWKRIAEKKLLMFTYEDSEFSPKVLEDRQHQYSLRIVAYLTQLDLIELITLSDMHKRIKKKMHQKYIQQQNNIALILEAEFFLGDVALTWERASAVEFSFFTLADSGAFVTHAPNDINEALALVRPFHWKVWPAIIITVGLSGPVLYALTVLGNKWQPQTSVKSRRKLFFDCVWFTTSLFLKQSEKLPTKSHKARFFVILLSVAATYVIGDMYSANLTSLLAKPGKEKSINTLNQLEEAMKTRGYNLFIERLSSTYSLLENGTGIYGRLWNLMNKHQTSFVVDSVEEGVKFTRDFNNVAVIAGRETLFFDIQRFGISNFHLSEKVNTAYSAIAFQLGCPYLENVNRILMAIFEAGILIKMTEYEYEKLGKQQLITEGKNLIPAARKPNRRTTKATKDKEKLKPVNIKMLRGAFYFVFIGHFIAGVALLCEIFYYRHGRLWCRRKNKCYVSLREIKIKICHSFVTALRWTRRRIRLAFNEAVIATLDYVE